MPSPRRATTFASILRSPALAVIAAYLLRMALMWLTHRHEDPIHPRFQTVGLEASLVARSLAMGKGFFGPFPGYQATTAALAPVYPFLGAIGYKLFRGDSYATLFFQTMNCAFSAATCWPICAIGKKLFGEKIGLASAWFWVFLPYAVYLPLEWAWDQSLSALLLALIVLATFSLREETSSSPSSSSSSLRWSGYGLLWALAALTNPTLCILLPFLLGWLVLRRRQIGLASLKLVATSVFMFVLALAPWTIRNYYAVGGFVFVKSNFGLEFWLGNNPAVKEVYSPALHPAFDVRERIALILNGEPNYNRAKMHSAIAYIEAHPGRFLQLSAERFEDNWTANYDTTIDPWLLALHIRNANIWFCTLFSIASIVGMILALRAHFWNSLPLALCILVLPIPYYITHTSLRYRHPIDPFLSIFTVYLFARLWSALRPRTTPKLAA